jgi:hypothetical protein
LSASQFRHSDSLPNPIPIVRLLALPAMLMS